MRLLSLPEELTPLVLLETEPLAPLFQGAILAQMHSEAADGHVEAALTLADRAFSVAWEQHQYEALAVITLYRADLLWRLWRWKEALDKIDQGHRWLQAQTSRAAHYNGTIALYFTGVVHLALRSDDEAARAFVEAQERLEEDERAWGYYGKSERVNDCRRLSRWIADLLRVQTQLPATELTMIVPLYEVTQNKLSRTGARVVMPIQTVLPRKVLQSHLPMEAHPAGEAVPVLIAGDEVPVLIGLHPTGRYAAVRLSKDVPLPEGSKVDDILLIEVTAAGRSPEEVHWSDEQRFIRLADGHIVFRATAGRRELVGIPRLILREQRWQASISSAGDTATVMPLPSSQEPPP